MNSSKREEELSLCLCVYKDDQYDKFPFFIIISSRVFKKLNISRIFQFTESFHQITSRISSHLTKPKRNYPVASEGFKHGREEAITSNCRKINKVRLIDMTREILWRMGIRRSSKLAAFHWTTVSRVLRQFNNWIEDLLREGNVFRMFLNLKIFKKFRFHAMQIQIYREYFENMMVRAARGRYFSSRCIIELEPQFPCAT